MCVLWGPYTGCACFISFVGHWSSLPASTFQDTKCFHFSLSQDTASGKVLIHQRERVGAQTSGTANRVAQFGFSIIQQWGEWLNHDSCEAVLLCATRFCTVTCGDDISWNTVSWMMYNDRTHGWLSSLMASCAKLILGAGGKASGKPGQNRWNRAWLTRGTIVWGQKMSYCRLFFLWPFLLAFGETPWWVNHVQQRPQCFHCWSHVQRDRWSSFAKKCGCKWHSPPHQDDGMLWRLKDLRFGGWLSCSPSFLVPLSYLTTWRRKKCIELKCVTVQSFGMTKSSSREFWITRKSGSSTLTVISVIDSLRGILGAVFVSLMMVLYQAGSKMTVGALSLVPNLRASSSRYDSLCRGVCMQDIVGTGNCTANTFHMEPGSPHLSCQVADPPIARLGYCEERGRSAVFCVQFISILWLAFTRNIRATGGSHVSNIHKYLTIMPKRTLDLSSLQTCNQKRRPFWSFRWMSVKAHHEVRQRLGVVAFRLEGPLFYANVERLEEWLAEMEVASSATGQPVKAGEPRSSNVEDVFLVFVSYFFF